MIRYPLPSSPICYHACPRLRSHTLAPEFLHLDSVLYLSSQSGFNLVTLLFLFFLTLIKPPLVLLRCQLLSAALCPLAAATALFFIVARILPLSIERMSPVVTIPLRGQKSDFEVLLLAIVFARPRAAFPPLCSPRFPSCFQSSAPAVIVARSAHSHHFRKAYNNLLPFLFHYQRANPVSAIMALLCVPHVLTLSLHPPPSLR